MSKFYRNFILTSLLSGLFMQNHAVQAQTQTSTFTQRITSGTDDAEEATAGNIYLNSSDLELVYDDYLNAGNQTVGLRFTNILVPPGATITQAYVQFTTDEIKTEATALKIEAQASDHAPAFTANAFDLSSRSRTTASVNWAPAAWATANETGTAQATPDLKNIIQELVNRPGWQNGTALALLFTGSGRRNAHAYEGSATRAAQLIIKYESTEAKSSPAPSPLIIAKNSIWRFHDLGLDLGTAWIAPGYDDATWPSGAAVLGYGDAVATTMSYGSSSTNKYPTYYLRHQFNVTDANVYDTLVFNIRRDDGAVVYLNGVEQFRTNMPTGPVTYLSPAATTVGNAAETTYYTYKIPASQLQSGLNTLAVSVHQVQGSSSDITFDLEVEGQLKSAESNTAVLAFGSNWKYLYNNSDQGTAWSAPAFNDASWLTGNGVLGYGNGDEATTLTFADAANKPVTAYFRKAFTVADTAGFKGLELQLIRDDAAVVYLNGTEVLRSNLMAGAFNYQTPAVTYVEGPDENTPVLAYINRKLLKPGENILAVEVHKYNNTESDLRFDAGLRLLTESKLLTPVVQNYACNPGASATIGCFTSVKPTVQQETFVIPETHTFQQLAKSGVTRYNSGSTSLMPGGNDFSAYIAQNNSSKVGRLSINHENSPGGVSMLQLHLDEQKMIWQPDLVHKVDFSGVVKTERNCSGGLTPWGTIITSEETTALADLNGDGYQDVGWNVEIDPVTGKVIDHDGDGKPDKLWALGRLTHENVVVSSDRVTVYQGEDGGTGGVYKFVANQAGNLSAGTLYVLQRNAANPTTGTWIKVPNTTQADRNNTGNLAATLGGTNWSNVEDLDIGPDGKTYFSTKISGTIWRFKDNGSDVSELEAWVTNRNYTITHKEGTQTENFGVGIDNLVFDGEGNLWALQDGGRNYIWVIRPDHTPTNPRVELFGTIPVGAEPTGLTFTPDYRYGFISLQHPSTANTQTQTDAAGNTVQFNAPVTLVFARKEYLGQTAFAPVFELGTDQTRCQGDSVKLTAFTGPDAVVKWSTGEVGPEITVATTGNYTATAYANNGKTYSDTVQVTFTSLQVELGENRSICATCSTTLDAGPGYSSYLWNTGATTQTINVTASGTYTVSVTNENNCTAADTIAVTVNTQAPAVSPVFELGANQSICQGQSVKLVAYTGTDAVVKWNTGATGSELTVITAGVYTATAYGNNGTQFTDSVEVTVSNIKVDLGEDIVTCSSCPVTLDAGPGYSSYLWNTGATTPSITATTPGTYTVTVTNQDGCTATDAINVLTIKKAPIKLVEVLPNPFPISAQIKVTMETRASVAIEVFVDGQLTDVLFKGQLKPGESSFIFQPAGNKQNMYILRVSSGGQVITYKLVKSQ